MMRRWMWSMATLAAFTLAGVWVVGVVGGCRGGDEGGAGVEASAISDPGAHEATFEDGLLRVTVRYDRTRMTMAGRLGLEIITALDEGFELRPIELEARLGEAWIVSRSMSSGVGGAEAAEAAGGDREVRRHRFTLEPYEPGWVDVAPIAISYREKGTTGEGSVRTLETEAVRIDVRSVLAEAEAYELGRIKGVVEPRKAWAMPVWAWVVVGVVLVTALGLAFFMLRSRRRLERERLVQVTAHEVALKRLSEVIGERLVERGLVKAFYIEVSGVLRRYIEDRFGLKAPERTTEEFLAESTRSGVLWADDVRELERFLAHCDLVKFARHEPDAHEVREVLDTVRSFIERTRIDEAQVVFDEQGNRRGRVEAENVVAAGAVAGRGAGHA